MKSENKIALLAGAALAAFLFMRKSGGVSGIGATKRRIWQEVEQAQRAGVDLNDPSGWEQHVTTLRKMASGKIKEDGSKPIEQRYFGQLRRAYRSIAGTTIRPDQSVIYNEYGDPILIYNDYHLDRLPEQASEWVLNEAQANISNPEQAAYWITIASIASGTKFVWASKGEHRGIQQLVFGQNAQAERKQRISYLASPDKGGIYPEKFAHKIWEQWDRAADDQDITNGVLEAIRDCISVGAAQKACVDQYMTAHQVQEPTVFEDLPF